MNNPAGTHSDFSSPSQSKAYCIKAWTVVLAAALYFFFEFFQVNVFNALDPYLLKEFNLRGGQLGNLSAFYFYAVVFCLIPAGLVLDRFSTKRVLLVEMTLCVAAVALFAMSQSLWQAKLARLLLGIGGCCVLLGSVRLATRWFAPRQLALVIGVIVTFAMTGGIMSQAPMTFLTDAIGWRPALWVIAGVGVVFFVLMVACIRDFPKGAKHVESHCAKNLTIWRSLSLVLRNRQNWLCGLYCSLMNIPVFLLGFFGVLYLTQTKGMLRSEASIVTSMVFLGLIIGSPLIGYLSDRLGRRKICMQICAAVALFLILLIMFLPSLSFHLAVILFFVLGLITSSQVLSYPVIAESNPPSIIASAESVAATLIMLGGFTSALFGSLMGLHWHHTFTAKNVPLYSAHDYLLAMSIIPVGFVLSLLCSFLVRETHGMAYRPNDAS